MSNYAAKAVRARKYRYCNGETWAHDVRIQPGDLYVRSVMFPGDINFSGRPWVHALCSACAETYDGTRGLITARIEREAAHV